MLRSLLFFSLIILILTTFALLSSKSSPQALVVYCSHDSIFAEEVFQKFTLKTGIKVIPRYDTEASKSLGLTEKILREKENSDCDVYWSNEMFSMAALKDAELLKPYQSRNGSRIPAKFKDKDGYWCGFSARMRVIIYNTEKIKDVSHISNNFTEEDLSRVTIALPLYGTTLTHFAMLQSLGNSNDLKSTYKNWQKRSLQIVTGNGPARNLVANGNCDYGWTDTDDYFGAVDKGSPVKMKPARLPNKQTIIIPNTVGIITHTTKTEIAQKFVDYLLSAENEIYLAKSKSRQLPLGPITQALPKDVNSLMPYIQESCDLKDCFKERDSLINWLKEVHQLK